MALSEQQLIAARHTRARRGKSFALRLAEAFFRRWPLYLLPVVLFIGLGVLQAKGVAKEYRSVGTVNVSSSTFLSDLTSVRTPDVGYETPATKTARNINERMSSLAFTTTVASAAGLSSALASGQITPDYIREHVSASPSGDTLLTVAATTNSPKLSQLLVSALIKSYTEYVLGVEVAGSKTAAAFYESRITNDNIAVTKAENDLTAFLKANPAPTVGDRSDLDALSVDDLKDKVTTAKASLEDDQTKYDTTQLAISSNESDITQRLEQIDPPQQATAPEATAMKKLFAVAIFAALGVILAAVALVLSAALDRTVRSSDDVSDASGLDVVATIPARKKAARRRTTNRSPAISAGAA